MSDDDMLVYPDEFKMGLKEEGKEHSDITGGDKEKVKKIVLAHLKEDPHYYSKLNTVMKAEEKRLSPIQRSMKNVPHEKDIVRNLQTVKAEETERLTPHYKPSKPQKPEGYKMTPKQEVETMIHLTPKKAEEVKVPRTIPGTAAPKTRKYLESQGLLTKNKAEKEEPFTPHSHSPGRPTPLVDTSSPPKTPGKPRPQWQKDLDTQSHAAENEKLSSKLLKKAEEELGKDKVEEMKNKTIVEDFAEEEKKKAEEKAKPPEFHAEPNEAGLMDNIMKKLDPAPAKPKNTSLPNLTKKTIRSFRR